MYLTRGEESTATKIKYKYRTFGKVRYLYLYTGLSKRYALRSKERIKADGHLARVVKSRKAGKVVYKVYIRQSAQRKYR